MTVLLELHVPSFLADAYIIDMPGWDDVAFSFLKDRSLDYMPVWDALAGSMHSSTVMGIDIVSHVFCQDCIMQHADTGPAL